MYEEVIQQIGHFVSHFVWKSIQFDEIRLKMRCLSSISFRSMEGMAVIRLAVELKCQQPLSTNQTIEWLDNAHNIRRLWDRAGPTK